MNDIYADIETYSSATNYSSSSVRGRHWGAPTDRTSTTNLDDIAAAPNAAIGDEQAAHQQRRQEIKRRLIELDALFFEDYGMPLPAPSQLAFECFMDYSPMVTMPLLGAEPGGTLIATWTKDVECLSLRFSDRFHLDFAITFRKNGNSVRRWGSSSLGNVFSDCPEAKRLASI